MVPDDYVRTKPTVSACLDRSAVGLTVTTGGTGVIADDVATDAVGDLFNREPPGFGEAFRWLSWEEVRTRSSRLVRQRVRPRRTSVVLPGRVDAVELATAKSIAEQTPHLAGLAAPVT